MLHDPGTARLTSLKAELLRDERALIAEGQRLVLHRGRELAAMGGKLAGSSGERQVQRFSDTVLWSERPPDEWPIGAMIAVFRTAAKLSPADRALQADLLRPLLRLARSADDLHGLRAQLGELAGGEHRP